MRMYLVAVISILVTLLQSSTAENYPVGDGRGSMVPMASEGVDGLMRFIRDAGNKLDIIFIIDASTSISIKHYGMAKMFVNGLCDLLLITSINVRVGVLQYGMKTYEVFKLSTFWNRKQVQETILGMDRDAITHKDTKTAQAMDDAMKLFAEDGRKGVRQALVVITDGNSENTEATRNAANAARAKDIAVFGVANGYPEKYGTNELMAIGNTKSIDLTIASTTDLENRMQAPTRRAIVSETSRADVVFIVDTSIDTYDLNLSKTCMINVVRQLDIARDKIRVAIITFSNDKPSVLEVLKLGQADERKAVENAIQAIQLNTKNKQLKDLTGALKATLAAFIKDGRPLDSGVARIAIIVSDGMLSGKINHRLGMADQHVQEAVAEMEKAVLAPYYVFPYSISSGHQVAQTALDRITRSPSRSFMVAEVTKVGQCINGLGKYA